MDRNGFGETMRKAEKLALIDYEINGSFANAPYTLTGPDNQHLKARIRTVQSRPLDGMPVPVPQFYVELYLPETMLANHPIDPYKPTPKPNK